MRFGMARSLLLSPVVLVALLGWLAVASLLTWVSSAWEAANTGQGRWPASVIDAVFWLHVLIVVACCLGSIGKSAANLVHREPLLPNAISIALSLPILIALSYCSIFLLNLPTYSVQALIQVPTH
jgi:hypothetical protein